VKLVFDTALNELKGGLVPADRAQQIKDHYEHAKAEDWNTKFSQCYGSKENEWAKFDYSLPHLLAGTPTGKLLGAAIGTSMSASKTVHTFFAILYQLKTALGGLGDEHLTAFEKKVDGFGNTEARVLFLMKLRGIGRKTAECAGSYSSNDGFSVMNFDIHAGIVFKKIFNISYDYKI
jgi:hypothetical protein